MTCIFHVVSVVLCAVFTEQTPQHPLLERIMVFCVLGPSTRAAYLRVGRDSGVPLACVRAPRQAGMLANDHSCTAFFFSCDV